jgi:hypothetical protein
MRQLVWRESEGNGAKYSRRAKRWQIVILTLAAPSLARNVFIDESHLPNVFKKSPWELEGVKRGGGEGGKGLETAGKKG